jgi:hypothetical protein
MSEFEKINVQLEKLNEQIKQLAKDNDLVYITGTYLLNNETDEYYCNLFTTDNALEIDIYKATCIWSASGVETIEESTEPGEDDLII